MKNKLIIQIGVIAVVFSIFLFIGCGDIFNQNNSGYGNVTINIGDSDVSRTLFPKMPWNDSSTHIESRYLEVEFVPQDGQGEKPPVTLSNNIEGTVTARLATGNWGINVTLYAVFNLNEIGYSNTYAIASGYEIINVTEGSNSVDIELFTGIGEGIGIFNYSGITLPSDDMVLANLKIYDLDIEQVGQDINLLGSNEGFLELESNYYILVLELEHTNGKIVKVEVVHIYPGMRTYAEGAGYYFTEDDFKTGLQRPAAPVITVSSVEMSSADFDWDSVEYASAYEVQYRRENEAFNFYGSGTTDTNISISGLNSNTRYYVRIRAVNSAGFSNWSNIVEITTLAGALATPSEPVVVAGNSELTVSWGAVTNASWYEVWYKPQDESGDGLQFYNNSNYSYRFEDTSINITGLDNNITYQVRIQAFSSTTNFSSFSSWGTADRATSSSLPGTTGRPYLNNRSEDSITISWDPVGGAFGYYVWSNTVDNPATADYKGEVAASSDLTMTVDNLSPGTIYYFWVVTRNMSATGAFSPALKTNTTLSAPSISNITPAKERLTINWNEVTNAQAYDIYLNTDWWPDPNANTIPAATVTNSTSATISELNPNQTYSVWVRAKRDNNGEWVFSNWSSYSQERVPNNETTLSNFRLHYYIDWWNQYDYYGTLGGNFIRVTVPYERNISSIQAYFDLSSYATADFTSGSSSNFNAPKEITVTAEDGETTTKYIIITTVDTPVNIGYEGPGDALGGGGVYQVSGINFNMMSVPVPSGGITFPTETNDAGTGTVQTLYQIAETEVTWELWNTVRTWAVANGYTLNVGQRGGDGSGSDQQPVTQVNWYNVVVWCNALTEYWNAQTSATFTTVYNSGGNPIRNVGDTSALNSVIPDYNATGFRLPTNNEWELAARWQGQTDLGNSVQRNGYYFTRGDSASGASANVDNSAECSRVAVHQYSNSDEVKTKAPNALGLYDMSGNVWEWTFDGGGFKGGSWHYNENRDYLRIGYTYSYTYSTPGANIGFRFVRSGSGAANATIAANEIHTLLAPEGFSEYKWLLNNIAVSTDNTLYLKGINAVIDEPDTAVTLPIGLNTITLIAYKEEGDKLVPYTKTITITVTP